MAMRGGCFQVVPVVEGGDGKLGEAQGGRRMTYEQILQKRDDIR